MKFKREPSITKNDWPSTAEELILWWKEWYLKDITYFLIYLFLLFLGVNLLSREGKSQTVIPKEKILEMKS